MKKLFNHTKRPQQEWEGYDESEYDWDSAEQDGEEDAYYAEEDEEGTYYADPDYVTADEAYEEGAAEDGEYYAEEAGAEVYAAGEASGNEAYYEVEGGEYEEEYEQYSEDEAYYEEEVYEDEAEDEYVPMRKQPARPAKKGGFFLKLQKGLSRMTLMDRIVMLTGIGVLVLALITGSVFVSARIVENQVSDFVNVGTQLDEIATIGEKGLLAVADAQLARIAAMAPVGDYGDIHYEEGIYEREVTVQLVMTSIQKDLKIKFTSQRTGKLVANVPFAVTVTAPDGTTSIWSDDDMDGIIYKKDITPGEYKVAMEKLTDSKYEDYIISTATKETEVKKDIAYEKVDVANEVKKESQVNALKEDTKKNETQVESALQDTVEWVESKVLAATYNEVSKSSVPNPLTLVLQKSFLRMAEPPATETPTPEPVETSTPEPVEPSTPEPVETSTPEPVETSTPEPVETSTPEPMETATPTPTPTPTPENTATPTPTPTPGTSASPSPTPTPSTSPSVSPSTSPSASPSTSPSVSPGVLVQGKVTVDKTAVKLPTKKTATVQATASGFTSGQTLQYTVGSANSGIATATVDDQGKVTVTGVAEGTTKLTVTVNYKDVTNTTTQATATIDVTVANKSISLDKESLTVFITEPQTINATITNAEAADPAVTAESNDENVAKVTVDKRAITIEGVNPGSCTITVKFTEHGEEVVATCGVTVKNHPKNDTTTRLKDSNGNLLYINDNGTYKEATYADYFKYDKFYTKGATKYSGWQTLSDGKVYYFTASGSKITGEHVIQGAKYTFASDGSLVTGSGTTGIDVSKWNGTIDWKAVKNSGIDYVIIRCGYRGSSQGSLIEDPKFAANIKGATAVGLKVGVYFFTQAVDEIEAVEEASMVLGLVKDYKISYPIFLDVEPSGGRADSISKEARTAVCKAFCKTIQSEGYTAGIYANKTWLETKMDASQLSAYKIWLAQYAATPTYKGRYDLWQYRSTGSVTGISGKVDMNISYLGY